MKSIKFLSKFKTLFFAVFAFLISCENRGDVKDLVPLSADFQIFNQDFKAIVGGLNPNWTNKEKYDYVENHLSKVGRSSNLSFEQLEKMLETNSSMSINSKSARGAAGQELTTLQLEIFDKIKSYTQNSNTLDEFLIKVKESKKFLDDERLSTNDKNVINFFIESFKTIVTEDYNYLTSEVGLVESGNSQARIKAKCGILGSICVGGCVATFTTLAFVGTGFNPGSAVVAGAISFFFCKWCMCCPSTKPENVGC